jgi:hypothetical protein
VIDRQGKAVILEVQEALRRSELDKYNIDGGCLEPPVLENEPLLSDAVVYVLENASRFSK